MAIFMHELKKIWRPSVLLVVLFLSSMCFYLFGTYFMGYLDKDKSLNGWTELEVLSQLYEEYGPTLEPEERLDAEKYLGGYFSAMDPFIVGNATYSALGIDNGEDLWNFRNQREKFEKIGEESLSFAEIESELTSPFYFGEYLEATDYAMWRLQSLDLYVFSQYDDHEYDIKNAVVRNLSTQEQKTFDKYVQTKAYRSIFWRGILEGTTQYFATITAIILLGVFMFLAPYPSRDNMNGMKAMQWSSKVGRKMIGIQFGAVVFSGAIFALLEFAILIGIFLKTNDFSMFYHQPIYTIFGHSPIPWINMSYMQYLLVLSGLAFLFVLCGIALIFFLSIRSFDYISMLLKTLPALVALGVISCYSLLFPFTFENALYLFTELPGTELVICLLLLVLGLSLCFVHFQKSQKADLL